MLRSLVSAHTILRTARGEFVSLIDPPEQLKRSRGGLPQRRDLAGPRG